MNRRLYTVSHAETHERLFPGDGERRADKLRAILLTKPGLVLSEWYVTCWENPGDDELVDEIAYQVGAQEFCDRPGEYR